MTAGERIAQLERWLHDLYSTAEKEMRGKWDTFFKSIRSDGDALLKKIDDAPDETTKKRAWRDYTAFIRDSTVTDRWFKKMVDGMAREYADAGKRAAGIINNERYGAFADGYNFSADSINNVAIDRNIGIRFDLCDAATVEYLEEHEEDLLLPPKNDPSTLDLAVWNAHNINSQVTQGIVQGESIPHLAERLSNVTRMNEVAAVRTARTMTTACENAGRVQSMRTAESWGVKTRKQWMCTHDARTRDSHLQLEGETVEENEEFSNGCRYPGDPKGRPEEVYNCRCTLGTVIDGFSSNLPPDKQGAIHVFVDGEELEQGRNYMTPTSYADRDAARRILEKREQKRTAQKSKAKTAPATVSTKNVIPTPAASQKTEEERPENVVPSVAGLQRGEAMSHEQADSGNVNPNYGSGEGYGINCQSCVVAYEARRRGYDVEVVANDADHPMCKALSNDTLLAWKNADGTKADFVMGDTAWTHASKWEGEKPTPKRVEKKLLDTLEEGGRYTIQFPWKGVNAGGHILMIEKTGGELSMYDPQTNRTRKGSEVTDYLGYAKFEKTIDGHKFYKYPAVTRVDDKEMNLDVVNQVLEAKK